MAFYPNRKNAEDSNISSGSLGAKINKYRELRNLSQKELGMLCGFKETTADSRTAQYEKNKRTPSEDVLLDIAKALGISKYSLFGTDLVPVKQMFHILFGLEDFHGLDIVQVGDDDYHLVFDKKSEEYEKDILPFLIEWHRRKHGSAELNEFFEDFADDGSTKWYDLWRAGYPDVDERAYEKNVAEIKMDKLQKEMDEINAKVNSAEALNEIEGIETNLIFGNLGEKWTLAPVSWEDVCDVFGGAVKCGLTIEVAPMKKADEDEEDNVELFSLRVDEITGIEKFKLCSAKIYRLIEMIHEEGGIKVSRMITSKNKELRLTYYTSAANIEILSVIMEYIKEMKALVEQQNTGVISKKEAIKQEEKIRQQVIKCGIAI